MITSFQSPYERWLPLGVTALGLIATGWLLWDEGYRRNELAVWGWGGGSVVAGVLLYLWVRFADLRRVCKTCGVRVVPSMAACRKCGQSLSWKTVAALRPSSHSTIPAHKSFFAFQSGAGVTAGLMIPFGAILAIVISREPRLVGAVVLAFVFVAVAAQVFVARRKLSELERRLSTAEGRLCSVCLYARNDGSDRCPECGVRETEVELRALWERTGLWMPSENPSDEATP